MNSRHCVCSLAALGVLALAAAGCGTRSAITAPVASVPASDSAPSWSPDGTRIAYGHSAGTVESPGRAGIYVVDTLGGAPVQILSGPYSYPDWSPDGRHLVVTGQRFGGAGGGLFTITATGDSLTRLSHTFGYAAKWSPDGTTIAYETYDSTQVYRLWLMASDGTGVRCLNPSGNESWMEPEWSPDGTRLAHVRIRAGIAQPEVFVMDVNGVGEQRLTRDGYEARYPTWSRDGFTIVWGSWRGSEAELWTMSSDGRWGLKLCAGWWPDWAPDSRHLAYTAAKSWNGEYRLYMIDALTMEGRQITR